MKCDNFGVKAIALPRKPNHVEYWTADPNFLIIILCPIGYLWLHCWNPALGMGVW